jgi:hypothetical protein
MITARRVASLVVVACALAGCGAPDRAVDPDGHDYEARAQSAPLPAVAIDEVVGAVGGVSQREAARTLERWLHASAAGDRLLATWPRNGDGTLDLERSPVRVSQIDASVGPGSKSKCGDITVVFTGEARIALRMRLTIPATAKSCRGLIRASRVTDGEAGPLLRAAIADARVPDEIETPAVAQN